MQTPMEPQDLADQQALPATKAGQGMRATRIPGKTAVL
jgi:hypothetical protein